MIPRRAAFVVLSLAVACVAGCGVHGGAEPRARSTAQPQQRAGATAALASGDDLGRVLYGGEGGGPLGASAQGSELASVPIDLEP
ncbi:MAG: hypothetical protein SFZ24_07800 [Planctomycetota bacterium]|nr:hypothetical protein [Planctomycetota bacterium]